uniref:Uncharacterized protein n=1 Tax=Anopheles farauti TaxID=69004 RepID=A0A182QBJ8_9DIPT
MYLASYTPVCFFTQSRKAVTRANAAGKPRSQPSACPKLTTPTSVLSSASTSGPPESPLQGDSFSSPRAHSWAERFLALAVRDDLERRVLQRLGYLTTGLREAPTAHHNGLVSVVVASRWQTDGLNVVAEFHRLRKLHQRHIIHHKQRVVVLVGEELRRRQHLATIEIGRAEMDLDRLHVLHAVTCRQDPLFVQQRAAARGTLSVRQLQRQARLRIKREE